MLYIRFDFQEWGAQVYKKKTNVALNLLEISFLFPLYTLKLILYHLYSYINYIVWDVDVMDTFFGINCTDARISRLLKSRLWC